MKAIALVSNLIIGLISSSCGLVSYYFNKSVDYDKNTFESYSEIAKFNKLDLDNSVGWDTLNLSQEGYVKYFIVVDNEGQVTNLDLIKKSVNTENEIVLGNKIKTIKFIPFINSTHGFSTIRVHAKSSKNSDIGMQWKVGVKLGRGTKLKPIKKKQKIRYNL